MDPRPWSSVMAGRLAPSSTAMDCVRYATFCVPTVCWWLARRSELRICGARK